MKNGKPKKFAAKASAICWTEDGKKIVIPWRPIKVTYHKPTAQSAKKAADRKKAA